MTKIYCCGACIIGLLILGALFFSTDCLAQMTVRSSANTELMRVTQTGQVGIGLSGPDARLHINGAENDGSSAGVKIQSGAQLMLLDGNEIDSNSGLYLNANLGGLVSIGTTNGTVQARPLAGTGIAPVYTTEDGILARGQPGLMWFKPLQRAVYANTKSDNLFPWEATIDLKTALGALYPENATHALIRIMQDINTTDFPSGFAIITFLFKLPPVASGWSSYATNHNRMLWMDTYAASGYTANSEVTQSATAVVELDANGKIGLYSRWSTGTPSCVMDFNTWIWVEGFYVNY